MNYDKYINDLRTEIIKEKMNMKRHDVIRKYQKELDVVIDAKNNDTDHTDTSSFTTVEITEKKLDDQTKDDLLVQLKTYLEALENHSKTYKDIVIEKRSPMLGGDPKKIQYVTIQQRLSHDELVAINSEIEVIKNRISELKNKQNQ